jgi:uncharacterized protein (PEP-CTERM system associated)
MTGCRVVQRRGGLRGARLAMLLGAVPAFLLDAGASQAQRATPPAGDSTDSFLLANSSPSPPPFAGTVLPAVGVTPSTGPDFRDHLLDALGETPAGPAGEASLGPDWQFKPQITVGEEWTDNAGLAAGSGTAIRGRTGADFITLLEPAIAVSGNTQRLQVNLDYAPTGEIFADHSDFSQFRQTANGAATATLMPNLFYIDARGAIDQQPVFGGLGPLSSNNLSPDQRETVSSVSVSPYFAHAFGGAGTAQAGVGYIYSATAAPSFLNTPGQFVPIDTAYNYGSSWLATRRAFASFTTGENYQRLQDRIGIDASFYDGSGELKDGRRVLVTDDVSYAINRFVSPVGEFGYENMDYPRGGVRYVGGVWAAGVRLTPARDTTVTVEYRYIDGFGAPYIYGSWQATGHIRLFGGYSEGISSFNQDQQSQLLAGNIGPSGVADSSLIAAPLLSNTGLFSGNQALNRLRRLNTTATYVAPRDTITVSFDYERSTLVGNAFGLPTGVFNPFLTAGNLAGDNTSLNYTAGVTWAHDLQPDLTGTVYAGYNHSRDEAVAAETASSVRVAASLTQQLAEKFSASLVYSGTYFVSGQQIGSLNQNDNTVTISVTKKL